MPDNDNTNKKKYYIGIFILLILILCFFWFKKNNVNKKISLIPNKSQVESAEITNTNLVMPELDFQAYDQKLLQIANNPALTGSSTSATSTTYLWPVKTVYPKYGALLPFNRIVAYYGNLYSKGMGVLGEFPENIMLEKLKIEVKKWEEADPETPVIPALHYISVVAQAGPGKDGKYRLRMPDKEIDKVLKMAEKINGLAFLDVQLGLSEVETEIPLLEKYLKLPNVHLGIDPEFAMHNQNAPGKVIGSLDAEQINFAAKYLAKIVTENQLTPKILVIHRFTRPMVTNYKNITPLPEVQIIMDMDGFGSQGSKLNTYKEFIYKEPVQFTGFKLFYKNDAVGKGLFHPNQIIKLSPTPLYIQYQ